MELVKDKMTEDVFKLTQMELAQCVKKITTIRVKGESVSG